MPEQSTSDLQPNGVSTSTPSITANLSCSIASRAQTSKVAGDDERSSQLETFIAV